MRVLSGVAQTDARTQAVKDRFQQTAFTARSLLSDFREVEQNFRTLDRAVRERIATFEGASPLLPTPAAATMSLGRESRVSPFDRQRSSLPAAHPPDRVEW